MEIVKKYQDGLVSVFEELEILKEEYENKMLSELEKILIGKEVHVKNSDGHCGVVESLYMHREKTIMVRIKLDTGGTFSLYGDEIEIR